MIPESIKAKLPTRDLYILTERFGLNGKKPKTLEAIGKKLNLTRERIRQLQNIAIRRVKKAMKEQGYEV